MASPWLSVRGATLAALLLAAACSNTPGPPRPRGLPNQAVWAGNVFIDCDVDEKRNVNRCRIYHPDGKLACERGFRLQPEGRYARRTELHCRGFDN